MTREEFEILCRPDVRRSIADNMGRDSAAIALDGRVEHARLVASQVKYLTRAESKLPSYAAAGCIIPPLAFEQSSGEPCAARKPGSGRRALDLTCGLGVDSYWLSRRFDRVTAVERDRMLADIARENFRRLGVVNVDVVCARAEEYLQSCDGHFDWIYADPDRRDAAGRKMVVAADCSPDVVALLPVIRERADHFCFKLSPMFDVDEAFRLFGRVSVEAVSWCGECKEVVVHDGTDEARIGAAAIHPDGSCDSESFLRGEAAGALCTDGFDEHGYVRLGVPDAALQKARLVSCALAGAADVWSENGFAFAAADAGAVANGLCRWYDIAGIETYSPRRLRRELKGLRVEILKRDFPESTAAICRACGIREGGDIRAAFTRIGERFLFIRLVK